MVMNYEQTWGKYFLKMAEICKYSNIYSKLAINIFYLTLRTLQNIYQKMLDYFFLNMMGMVREYFPHVCLLYCGFGLDLDTGLIFGA